MGKFIVILLASVFVCGVITMKFPGTREAMFGNHWGFSWLALMFLGCILGGYKLTGK